jgi:hypothetical protein
LHMIVISGLIFVHFSTDQTKHFCHKGNLWS